MRKKITLIFIAFLSLIILIVSCDLFPESTGWKAFGLEGKYVMKLKLFGTDLYACTGSSGLWKRNIAQSNSTWQYLGMADSSLSAENGIVDVLVDPYDKNKIIVTFSSAMVESHCIYCTLDNGNNWFYSDSGLAFTFNNEFAGYNQLRCLQYYPDYILGTGWGAFSLENFGGNWEVSGLISPEPQSAVMESHSLYPRLVYLGGHDMYFNPVLFKSNDGGKNWKNYSNNDLGLSPMFYATIQCISFDPVDSNIVYLGLGEKILKTIDGGDNWQTLSDSLSASVILNDPNNSNHLWVGVGSNLKETYDAGISWSNIEYSEEGQILDMIIDPECNYLYVSTVEGVYKKKN